LEQGRGKESGTRYVGRYGDVDRNAGTATDETTR